MVAVERLVTEWGFPALRWRDRISNMKGLPQNPLPRIDTTEVTRTLWINFNGVQVLAMDAGGPAVVGHWHEWENLTIGTTRSDLTGEHVRLLGMNRLQWIEHQTLTASFSDGTVNRIATSAVNRDEMEVLHRAIHRVFLINRANYAAPQDGLCWARHFEPVHVKLEPGEKSPTRTDVSEAECQMLKFKTEFPIPSIAWKEPVRTRGGWFGGERYHLVERMLFVGRGFREGHRNLAFHSYKPGTEGAVEVHAEFAFLKGFRVVDSRETNASALQPLQNTLPGLSVVADFRYGLSLPVTCAYVPNDLARQNIELFAERLQNSFMPLVGQSLTDEQLGFPPRA